MMAPASQPKSYRDRINPRWPVVERTPKQPGEFELVRGKLVEVKRNG